MKQNFFVILLATMLVSSAAFSKTSLAISQGTMHVGGNIQLPITVPKNGSTTVGFQFTPSFDYFLTHSFALGIAPIIRKDGLTDKSQPWYLGVQLRGTYYFDFGGAVYPYLGAGGSVVHVTKRDRTLFQATVPIGVLVALNSRVALDFGLPLEFTFTSNGYEQFNMPIGYAGVKAFF